MALPAKSSNLNGIPGGLSGNGPGSQQPLTKKLKKGELLFAEGENSRAMYFLKSGMIRLFKKKGDSNIELDTVHTGQVLGELAFLDGNPRSASGEALTECDLIEISGPTFQEVIIRMPEWLKILLKTVVGRLRTASTRIRQLEVASSEYSYSERDGKRSSHYVYLSMIDILKISSAMLLVASRNGQEMGDGIDIPIGLLQRYANQIMGVPIAKVTTFLDIMAQSAVVWMSDDSAGARVVLKDAGFLEQMIGYFNEENLLESSKRHDISIRGFLIMSLVAKHLAKFPKDPTTGLSIVNLAEVRKNETTPGGRDPFKMEDFNELVKLGYCTNPNVKSNTEVFANIKADVFMHYYRLQRIGMSISAVNEQKRKATR